MQQWRVGQALLFFGTGFLIVGCVVCAAMGLYFDPDQLGVEGPRIRRVLADQADAWNRGDLDGFMAGYLNSPELTFRSGGTVTKGYDETLARYRTKYQAPGAEMGKLSFDDLAVKRYGRTTVVTGRWTLDRTADTPTGLFTLRMELTGDGWKIVDDHTSSVEPTPQKPKVPEKK